MRNAALSSVTVAPSGTPRTAHTDVPSGAAGARDARASARVLVPSGNGGWPRSTRLHARAQMESMGTSGFPHARSAAASASSHVAAPPPVASGFWKGTRLGGAVHHAAHKKRRRFVLVMEQTGANSSVTFRLNNLGASTVKIQTPRGRPRADTYADDVLRCEHPAMTPNFCLPRGRHVRHTRCIGESPLMRRLLVSLLSSAFLLPLACTNKVIIKKKAPDAEPASADAGVEEDAAVPEPEPVDPTVVDLGAVETGTDVSFQVPDGALGFNIVAEGSIADFDPQNPFGIEQITDPSGKVVHADFTPKGGTIPISVAAYDALASATVPQGQGVADPLPGGTWKVRFGVAGTTTTSQSLTAKVRIQLTGDGAFHGGKLNLHIHIPPGLVMSGDPVDETAPESDPNVMARVDGYFDLVSSLLGIGRGTLTFHVAPAGYTKIEDTGELLAAFAVSGGDSKDGDQAMHILFTNEISENGQPFALGISPGIPGSMNRFGRRTSGIVVSTERDVGDDVNTMIHETGHFFGLNHTTEFDGKSADPLTDTPRCTTIANQDLQACPDQDNVMFAAGALTDSPVLSPSQVRVYRASTIYSAFPASGSATQSLVSRPIPNIARRFTTSGRTLSPVERELAMGTCGMVKLDAAGIVTRYGGRTTAVRQLQATANDADVMPVIRGRARLALKALGESY